MKTKKILKLTITLVLLISMCILPVNAASGPYTIANRDWSGTDTILNCYTSGSVISGTQVSTWSYTGNASQRWYVYSETNGRVSLRPQANTSLALNANRSYIGTTANVITAATNVPEDYGLIYSINTTGAFPLALAARGAHYTEVFLTCTGERTLCTWQYHNGNAYWYVMLR